MSEAGGALPRALRILEVIEFFSPSMGGSAQVAYQVSRRLAERGHEVTVAASDFSADGSRFPDAGCDVRLFPSIFSRWGFYVTPGLLPWARQHLAEYDVVHLHNVRTFQNVVIGSQARRLGIPYLMSAHGSLPLLVERKAVKAAFDTLFAKRLIRGPRALIAVSAVEVEQYLAAGIDREKIHLVHNGLDLDEYVDLPTRGGFCRRLGIPVGAPLVLSLGRIHRIKGIDHLIAAFSRLRSARPEAHLVIAGPDGGDLVKLQALSSRLGMAEQVHFPGPLYGRDKLAALADADVVAAPSAYEIFGLVPFEALMCGTPVVVTEGGGAGELIRKAGAGYLAPYGDEDALAGAILEALGDPAEAQRRVAAGQAFVREHLGWDSIAGTLETLYATPATVSGFSSPQAVRVL